MTSDSDNNTQPTTTSSRPTPHNALPCSSENIAHIELFRPKTITSQTTSSSSSSSSNNNNKKKKRRAPLKKYHLLFAVMYLYQIYWIYSTVGVPYKEFLDKAEREGFEGE